MAISNLTSNNMYGSGAKGLVSGINLGVSYPQAKPATTSLGIASPAQTSPTPLFSMSTGGSTPTAQPPVTSPAITSHPAAPVASPYATPVASVPPVPAASTAAPVKGILPPSYADYVSKLGTAATPNATQTGLVQNISNTAAGNAGIGASAADIAKQYGQKIADVGGQGARFEAGQLTTGTSPVAEGNAAVTAQTVAAQQAALAQGESAALQGTAQQLSAQQQAANAYGTAGTLANTQQGQAISALGTAAGYAQPSPAAYGQTVFNPLTGQYEGGGGLPPEVMQQYAQMAANGQISSIPGAITSNPVLSAQLNAAAKAINPNYSPITSAAQGSAAADLTGQANAIQAQANGAENNFTLMYNIAKEGGVNDTNVPILNTLQNNVNRGLTSSAAVANFQSLIQSVRSQYASILGGGTVTVEALQEAQTLIPNDISLSALDSLGTNLKKDAGNRVAGIQQQIQSAQGGGGTSSTSTGGGGFAETW